MPGGKKSLELLHKAQKVIPPLTDIITTFSPLGHIPKQTSGRGTSQNK